jgi:glycosyltransferase involved in cell wall biosynthesis
VHTIYRPPCIRDVAEVRSETKRPVPSISAIIPLWNRAHVIGAAIDSVLAQKIPADWSLEIILVDDGSTDDLDGALRPYGDRILRIRHHRNAGAAAARNTGIAATSADYLAFLDSDDAWMPNKLAAQIAFMQANGYSLSCTACHLARPAGPTVIWPQYETGLLGLADIVWGCFLSPGTTMVCRPSVFEEVGMFDSTLERHEDWDWLLRFSSRHHLAYLAEPLARREPSPHANKRQVLAALDRIRATHLSTLLPRDQRHFESALALEAAAAYFRQGHRFPALLKLIKSLWLAPFDHATLATVVSSRFLN